MLRVGLVSAFDTTMVKDFALLRYSAFRSISVATILSNRQIGEEGSHILVLLLV